MPCILDTSVPYQDRSFCVPSSIAAFAKAPLRNPCPSDGSLAENNLRGPPTSTAPPECSWGGALRPRALAQKGGVRPGSPLTGGSCATPRCAAAGSEESLRCPGSSRAGGNAAAPARHSRWPQGRRLCCGDRRGDQSGLGYQTQTPSIGRLVPEDSHI